MIAVAEFVLVRNHIHHRVKAVHIRADPHRLLLNAGVDFRYGFDLGIHRFRIHVNLMHEIGKSLDAEIHPLAKVGVVKVAKLEVFSCIQPGLLLEFGYGVVVKTAQVFSQPSKCVIQYGMST